MSCCALALGLAGAPETSAQTVWEGDAPDPDGTNWFVGENWNTATVPGVGAATNVVVVFDDDGVPNQPIIDGSELLYETVDLGTAAIQVDRGLLTIRNAGELHNSLGYIGQALGRTGAVIVTGEGSIWENTHSLYVGYYGTGTLNIEDGGTVLTGGSAYMGFEGTGNGNGNGNGVVTVTGNGSTWDIGGDLVVGREGTGNLTIAERGTVNVNDGRGVVTVAQSGGSFGTVNIGAGVGETPVAPGTLKAGSFNFGEGTGALNFNHTDESGGFEFAPGISGIGTINHVSGFTNFTGDSSGFMDTTNVTGGTLSVNNVLGGTVIVDGGRLEGIGRSATST